jgi:hypothetical protein
MYAQLLDIAGPTYLWERFADELRAIHIRRGMGHNAKRIRDFTPERLRLWLEEQHRLYFERTGAEYFKLHTATRGAAMSQAVMNGVTQSDASVYFGCHPITMHRFYLSLDEERIGDRVFEQMNGSKVGRNEGDGNGKPRKNRRKRAKE